MEVIDNAAILPTVLLTHLLILQLEGKQDDVEEMRLETARKQNLDTIYDWIAPNSVTSADQRTISPGRHHIRDNQPTERRRMPTPRSVWSEAASISPETAADESKQSRPSSAKHPTYLYNRDDMDASERGVGGRSVAIGVRPPSVHGTAVPTANSERATRSQAEALQRLKENRSRSRRVMNYNEGRAAEAAAMAHA